MAIATTEITTSAVAAPARFDAGWADWAFGSGPSAVMRGLGKSATHPGRHGRVAMAADVAFVLPRSARWIIWGDVDRDRGHRHWSRASFGPFVRRLDVERPGGPGRARRAVARRTADDRRRPAATTAARIARVDRGRG